MAKKREALEYRIDPTRQAGKKGVQYRWTVFRGTTDLDEGICNSYGAAQKEAAEAMGRMKGKEPKPFKAGSFLGERRKAKK
jgi:hypothetical protein